MKINFGHKMSLLDTSMDKIMEIKEHHRKLAFQFKNTQKQKAIEKDNQRLLNQLVKISIGKNKILHYRNHSTFQKSQSPVNPITEGTKSDIAHVTHFKERRGTDYSPKKPANTIKNIKSLHVTARKNELNRIEKENTKIALKIFFAESEMK